MSKVLEHVENARANGLIPGLSAVHEAIVKFRLMTLHMDSRLDSRLVGKFDTLADDIEAEVIRITSPKEEVKSE